MGEIITLDYGSGGRKTAQLIEEVLLPAFANTALAPLGDGARVRCPRSTAPGGSRAGTSANWPSAAP